MAAQVGAQLEDHVQSIQRLKAKFDAIDEGVTRLEKAWVSPRLSSRSVSAGVQSRGMTVPSNATDVERRTEPKGAATMPEDSLPGTLEQVQAALARDMGTEADDEDGVPQNDDYKKFAELMQGANYYDYIFMMAADPKSRIETIRGYLKAILLPLVQIGAPIVLTMYSYQEYHWEKNGICPDQDTLGYRLTGFIMIIYSSWQIEDNIGGEPSLELACRSARHFNLTAMPFNHKYQLGFWAQWLCGLFLQITLYMLMASTSNPLNIVVNCVALNFLLDIDNEWVGDKQKAKIDKATAFMYKRWRNSGKTHFAIIEKELPKQSRWRRMHAEAMIQNGTKFAKVGVSLLGYFVAFFFGLCKANW
jgi:hypothetical protein